MIKEFSAWLITKQREIEHVGELLSTQLSTAPTELIEECTEIEAWGSRIGELLANVEAYLSHGKLYYLPKEDKRESERKAIVDDSVADIRKMRDILSSYKDCIEKRISLVQSILRYESIHVSPEVKGPVSLRNILPRDSTFE